MDVVERFLAGKTGDPHLCEDSIVVTDAYAAIVDGATDITGRNYDGVTGGRWAMMACVDAIEQLPKNSDAHAAVSEMTRQLARRVDSGLPAAVRPSASVTIYSVTRRQIWQIGDVGFHYPGLPSDVGQPRKLVDQIAASFRAAIFAAEAAARPISLDRAGPARAAVRALVARQGALRNTIGPYGYSGIDGRPVPPSLVVVHGVPDDVDHLVLASDGYPDIRPTLAGSEALLARLLTQDPWCVGPLMGTKGVTKEQISYDDRAYLRIRI